MSDRALYNGMQCGMSCPAVYLRRNSSSICTLLGLTYLFISTYLYMYARIPLISVRTVQGPHEHIQTAVMPEIDTHINQSITESQDPELPEVATPGIEHYLFLRALT
jgi:hypothetical protein